MIRCKLFGHKPQAYFKYEGRSHVDGIGRPHLSLLAICNRCDKRYRIGAAHVWTMDDYERAATKVQEGN